MSLNSISIGDYTFNNPQKLGEGTYGTVYKINFKGKDYALKLIKSDMDEGIVSLRELDIMTRLKHPNLMDLNYMIFSYDPKDVKYGIVMDMADMDLYKVLRNKKWRTESRLSLLFQITDGLDYLHKNKYLHLDIKPGNILLYKNKRYGRLTDFGLSLLMEKNSKYYPKQLVSIDHRAPEILDGSQHYNTAVDIWALGIVFLEVLSYGKSLFSNFKSASEFTVPNVKAVLNLKLSENKINKTLNIFLKNLREPQKSQAISLLTQMLNFNPSKRPSTQEILKHPLFSKYNKQGGIIMNPRILKPKYCNIITYYAFDNLMQVATRLPISLETFFISADIFQRSLHYATQGETPEDNYKNLVFLANLSLYMGIKMIESYHLPPKKLVELNNGEFSERSLIRGEMMLTNNLDGIMYPKNLFTQSSTFRRLELGFNLLRNCFAYHKLNLEKWKEMNDKEEKSEGTFDKYIPFKTFIVNTNYYKKIKGRSREEYIPEIYKKDKSIYG